jgi:hypothetical protein
MPTTVSTPASFSSVRTAFNTEGYGISTSFFAYRQGGGIVPATSGFNAIGAGTAGDPLRMSQFSGFTVPSLVTFTPAGGASAGAAVLVSDYASFAEAEVIISCSQNATWNYVRTTPGSGTEFVNLSNGGVGTQIIFRLNSTFGQISNREWTLNATAGGITQYWIVNLTSEYA